jgi:hypothetical protein
MMKAMLKTAFATSMVTCAALLLAGTAMIWAGPTIETRFFPVVDTVQATLVDVDASSELMHLAAYGRKVRQCQWQSITAMVHKDGTWHQGKVYFSDPRVDKTPLTTVPASRPLGAQSLGEIYVFPMGDRVQIYLAHTCHPFWQTVTFLYELDFAKKPYQVR